MRGGFGGGVSGVMGGMRGITAGGISAPTLDSLTDEGVVGSVYDHKVVMRLLTYLRPYKTDVFIAVASVLIYAAGYVAIPLLLVLGINAFVNEGDRSGLHIMALVFLAVALVQFGANYLQFVYMPKVGQSILYGLRTQMFDHLQSLSPSFFHRTQVGRIMSRNTSDVIQLQETFELLVQSLGDIVSLVGIVILMLVVLPVLGMSDWRLALMCLSVIPLLFFILGFWQRYARRCFMRIRRAIAMVNGEYNENITGVRVVESLNRQKDNLKHFDELNYEHLDANVQASRFSGGLNPVVETLIGFAFGVVVVMGGSMVLDSNLEWGVLVGSIMWIQRFFEPVRLLTMQYSQLQRGMASGVRIFEILDLKAEVEDRPGAVELTSIRGEVRYEGVGFHYVPGTDVLKDVDLHISPRRDGGPGGCYGRREDHHGDPFWPDSPMSPRAG